MPAAAPAVTTAPRPLRRLAVKLVALVLAKFALLTLVWWAATAAYPRPDTRPAAVERLLAPSSSSPHGGQP
ncbi:hypothetical protein [Fulvimonas soli]|jgi:hypothetical protein|uniref:Uncharacterized protein n=1 Tax=Fulvimonas soli TaxID=155197 RepID=A0A316HKW6_9GAMM|nr:hypothetical protein [Fulvimonas soli]PWK81875.1 hypothetical protein C7456_11831 [Fulvimonas soli]TNY27974.1 hypothetical protein BV497_00570 [Fulvimonas soli]